MAYSTALIIFCCNGIIILTFMATIEFFKQREKNIARKQEENDEQNWFFITGHFLSLTFYQT